jgi:hypothetical protein
MSKSPDAKSKQAAPQKRARPSGRTGCPLRPSPKAPGIKVSDTVVTKFHELLRNSPAVEKLKATKGTRGPAGFPIATIIMGLVLAQYSRSSTNISAAWETLFFGLHDGSRDLLDVPKLDLEITDGMSDPEIDVISHQQHAFAKQVYRSLEQTTLALDPAPHDRRRRLSIGEAEKIKAQWEAPENADLVRQLEEIAQDIVLAPVIHAQDAGLLREWPGHAGLDDTPVRLVAKKPVTAKDRASLEITAGLYTKGGAKPRNKKNGGKAAKRTANTGTRRGASASIPKGTAMKTDGKAAKKKAADPDDKEQVFAYGLILAIAGHGRGALAGKYPGLCLGMILRTPGTEPGRVAVRALRRAVDLGLVREMVCMDRGITQSVAEDLDLPLLEMGLDLIKHYRDLNIDHQGDFKGATLVGGDFYCPHMDDALKTAGTSLISSETEDDRTLARDQIGAREPFRLHVKERMQNGDQRRQCPAVGLHATVSCPRRAEETRAARTIDLNTPLPRVSQTLPSVRVPSPDTEGHPEVCTRKTITIPATVLAKWRQRYPVFSDQWQQAWSPLRSQNEGGNGNLKRFAGDTLDNPQARLAHGRVVQTLLVAIIIFVANVRALTAFRRARAVETGRAERQAQQDTKHEPDDLESVPIEDLIWVDPEGGPAIE